MSSASPAREGTTTGNSPTHAALGIPCTGGYRSYTVGYTDPFVALLREGLLRTALGKLERERGQLDQVAGKIARREADPYALASELSRTLER